MTALGAVWSFDAIGTTWRIETAAPLATRVRDDVTAVIDGFDAEWSRFRPDSVVSRLAVGGEAPLPADAPAMLALYRELSDATDGAVNPLVGASLERLGYDSAYSFVVGSPRAAPADWRDRLTWTDVSLRVAGPAVIDVGALGKGRLVDLVYGVLQTAVDGAFVVDASGDLRLRGAPQRIALEHPFDPRRAIGVIELADGALCASAVGRRAWRGLHHVLDARTGMPVRTVAATWAVADEAMRADAVATALFFDGGAELAHDWGVEWVRMTTDGRVEWSPASTADLFT
jgi:thiamine biosynthesis lipoprotein